MAPTIYCVRHAQGLHNLSVNNHSIPDPDLTELGKRQCHDLEECFPQHDKIDLIVASPIRRTIHTALLSFHSTIKRKGLNVIALPDLQETSDLPCDTGSIKEKLEEEFANEPVDLSLVDEGWNCKRGKWAPTTQAIQNRARSARQWLKNRPEKNIVVVTHGGFLHYLTKDWTAKDELTGTGWENTEFRWYYFKRADLEADEEADVEEFPDSKRHRRGNDHILDAEEETNLKRTVTNEKKSVPREQESAPVNGPAGVNGQVMSREAALNTSAQTADQRPHVIQAKLAELESKWKQSIEKAKT